jgi:MFS family permease
MVELLNNMYFVGVAMAVIIFFTTQLVKLPIKHFTSKISDERARRMANFVILLIPFALGILCDFLYSTYVLHTAFSIIVGLGYGTAGISLYSVIERFFKVKIKNPYETEDGKAVAELVDAVVEDKKVDKKDKDLVKEFLKKVK